MATTAPPSKVRTPILADVITDAIPAARVVLHPTPGTATVADVEAMLVREGRLCELIDGVLVEKVMGWYESTLAAVLIQLLRNHVAPQRLGIVAGEGGIVRLAPRLVRIPDVAFFARARLPEGKRPTTPIATLAPDLAVEVLSESNTQGEMEQKLRDYLDAGVRLVWYLDPKKRMAWAYESSERMTCLDESGTLDGGAVLPGFTLKVSDWLDADD